jgi:hypothetical protein
VVQRGDGSRFALKSFVELLLGNLHGDLASQARVFGEVYLAHPALAD